MYSEPHDYVNFEFDYNSESPDRAALMAQREKELAANPNLTQAQRAGLYAIAAARYGLPLMDFANPFARDPEPALPVDTWFCKIHNIERPFPMACYECEKEEWRRKEIVEAVEEARRTGKTPQAQQDAFQQRRREDSRWTVVGVVTVVCFTLGALGALVTCVRAWKHW